MSAKTKAEIEEFPNLFNFTSDDNVHPISQEPMFTAILADLPGMDGVVARARAADSTFVTTAVPGFSDVRDVAERILAGEQTDMDEILAADDEAERLARRNRLSAAVSLAARDIVNGEARRLVNDNRRRIAARITDLLQGTVADATEIVKSLGTVRQFSDIERRPDLIPVWGKFAEQVKVFAVELKIAETFSRLRSAHDLGAADMPGKRWPKAWLFNSYTAAWPEFYLADGAEVDGEYTQETVPWFEGLPTDQLLRTIVDKRLVLKACTPNDHQNRNKSISALAKAQLRSWKKRNGAPPEVLPVFESPYLRSDDYDD